MISDRVLLEGAWFALEQCGVLLRDAVALYERESPVTALGLALLAREEMGKSRILLDVWRDVVNNGTTVRGEDIRKLTDDHVVKQTKAQVSLVQTVGEIGTEAGETGFAKLLRTVVTSGHSESEREEARQILDDVSERQRDRIPEDRHKIRMRALYVDLNESGTGWNRPNQMIGDVRTQLEHAVSDYVNRLQRLQVEVLPAVEPKLAAALEQWPERPALPEPVYLK
jgi:AbiV family abortive infection protein